MRLLKYLLISSLIACLCSCGGDMPGNVDVAAESGLVSLYGSSIEGITVTALAHQCYALEFAQIPPDGQFVQLQLPAGLVVTEDVWSNEDMVLKVVGNSAAGVDIGIRPAPGYGGEAVTAVLTTTPGTRTTSIPPTRDRSAVLDLTILDLGAGRIRLEWTENNLGDYNFNGQVEVSDLTPLGVHFQEEYIPGTSGEMDTTVFWVDGQRDGFITVADITPIGMSFMNTIGGYNVLRNGERITVHVGELATVPRDEAEMRSLLPPRYSFEYDNSSGDEWVVAPVDWEGAEGIKSNSVSLDAEADLHVNLSITGLDLLDLNGSGESGPLGLYGRSLMKVVDSFEILRRIDPGDVPNLLELGNGQGTETPYANFSDLPRQQALALLVMYAPVNDLVSGDPKGGSGLRGASQVIGIEHETTVIPFRLPESGSVHLDVAINLVANPDGGYFTDVDTDTFDSVHITKSVRLNSREALVSMDNDGNDDAGLEFADEAQLSDTGRFAASDMRLQREVDRDEYGAWHGRTVYGGLASLDEPGGQLELSGVYIEVLGGSFIQQESLTVFFSEDSDFIGLSGDMVPSELSVGEFLRLETHWFENPELDPQEKFWMHTLYIEPESHDPLAVLTADPDEGAAPLFVAFDASNSVDLFGEIVKYEFDFDDGGGWVDYGLTNSAVYTYTDEGNYVAKLRVTDDELNEDVDEVTIYVSGMAGEGTVNIGITINFNGWSVNQMTTRVVIYDHEPSGVTDIDWIGRDIGDPNPFGRQDTTEPEDGVEQVLTWNGVVDGTYWYSVYRAVTEWEGELQDYAVFGPFTVSGAGIHDFSHVGEQSGNPPPPS